VIGVVLGAGRGERMYPLSAERPKALLPTLDLPQLTWALAGLKAAGVRRAWVNARGADGEGVAREVGRAAAVLELDVQVSPEPEEPLGTAGALGRLSAELDETFLLVNADVASSVPFGRLVEAHRAAGGPATLVGIPTADRADLVAEEGWVVELVDRSRRNGAGHVYAGIGVFEPSVLRYVPDGVSHLFDTVMGGLVRDAGAGGKGGLAVFEWTGYWRDLADPAAYLRVNLEALSGVGPPGRPPALQGPPQRCDALAYVGPGAEVEGVDLACAVVGAGARIEPGTRLERCVVWDGARVDRGTFADAVLTPGAVVAVGGTGSGPVARNNWPSRRIR